MSIVYIPTRADLNRFPDVERAVSGLLKRSEQGAFGEGVLYYGWPKFTDYDAIQHYVDLALVSSTAGVVFIRFVAVANVQKLKEVEESISQATAIAFGQMVRSPLLRKKGKQSLKFDIQPMIFSPGWDGSSASEIECFSSEVQLLNSLEEIDDQRLDDNMLAEIRSILEGVKALVRPIKRAVSDTVAQSLAASYRLLEEEIANFDSKQRQVALTALGGPQRIRGLAGSGKTVILAMKAALMHLDNPDAKILVTYYTRSLHDHLRRLITRFYRHFGEGDPNWKNLHVNHGWGRKDLPGVYREASLRAEIAPMSFTGAQLNKTGNETPFGFACRTLIATGRVKPFYDLVLIDEGQDFPDGFYELCFFITKKSRDKKQIVWAYDELQDVFDVKVRRPEELFGTDDDGKPRISLDRALPENTDTNDFVLPKTYRNQRDILVLAHSIGFGVYGQPVQMLQDRAHWEDVGYQVESGDMRIGSSVVIKRPDQNSPSKLTTPSRVPLVEVRQFDDMSDEISHVAKEFKKFILGGLLPEDLMAISIDDRQSRYYLSALSEALAAEGISANNITADRYSQPAFTIEGKCTLSTVYSAKGNEAAVVAVLGCDAVPLDTRTGRNRLFTAFTRTKGWLRISGTGENFNPLKVEIERALSLAPEMKFKMPNTSEIEMIQRNLSEKNARLQRAQAEMDRIQEEFGLTSDDMKNIASGAVTNGRK